MNKILKCAILLLGVALSSCTDKKEKYMTEFADLVNAAQFHPAEKTDGDWKDIVEERTDFMRKKFMDVYSKLTSEDKVKIDSLDNVLKGTVLRYTKSQKVYEAITKE